MKTDGSGTTEAECVQTVFGPFDLQQQQEDLVVDLLTLGTDHYVHGPRNLHGYQRRTSSKQFLFPQVLAPASEPSLDPAYLIAEGQNLQVVHRVFFPGRVSVLQKHRQPA